MKFTYDNADLSKTIKTYYNNGAYFLIEFLDGTKESYILSPKTEELIKYEMIKQALERDEKYNRKKCLIHHQFSSLTAVLSIFSAVSVTENKNFLAIFEMIFLTSFLSIISSTDKLIELKKYKLFLELYQKNDKQELEKLWNTYFASSTLKMPDINTLDTYKYTQIKSLYNKSKNK